MDSQKPPRLTLTKEELDKVTANRLRNESIKVDENWLFVAEFGIYFGWAGVQAVRNNEITMQEANMLLGGARKVSSKQLYDNAYASLIGAGSAQSKKPNEVFKKATRDIVKHAKADTL